MITVEAHTTEAGKLALTATDDTGLKTRKYIVGGYQFYVVTARRSEWSSVPGQREMVKQPSIRLHVDKRTGNRQTARYEKRRNPGSVILSRIQGGEYIEVAS